MNRRWFFLVFYAYFAPSFVFSQAELMRACAPSEAVTGRKQRQVGELSVVRKRSGYTVRSHLHPRVLFQDAAFKNPNSAYPAVFFCDFCEVRKYSMLL